MQTGRGKDDRKRQTRIKKDKNVILFRERCMYYAQDIAVSIQKMIILSYTVSDCYFPFMIENVGKSSLLIAFAVISGISSGFGWVPCVVMNVLPFSNELSALLKLTYQTLFHFFSSVFVPLTNSFSTTGI